MLKASDIFLGKMQALHAVSLRDRLVGAVLVLIVLAAQTRWKNDAAAVLPIYLLAIAVGAALQYSAKRSCHMNGYNTSMRAADSVLPVCRTSRGRVGGREAQVSDSVTPQRMLRSGRPGSAWV